MYSRHSLVTLCGSLVAQAGNHKKIQTGGGGSLIPLVKMRIFEKSRYPQIEFFAYGLHKYPPSTMMVVVVVVVRYATPSPALAARFASDFANSDFAKDD